MFIYFIGVFVAMIMCTILSSYYFEIKGENVDEFPLMLPVLMLLSWFGVIMLCRYYKEYKIWFDKKILNK